MFSVVLLGMAGFIVACSTTHEIIDVEHHDDYVTAVAILHDGDRARFSDAHRMLDAVVRHDPKFAPGHVAMAHYTLLSGTALAPQVNPEPWLREFILPKVERHLQNALEIAPDDAEALAFYSHVAARMHKRQLARVLADDARTAGIRVDLDAELFDGDERIARRH